MIKVMAVPKGAALRMLSSNAMNQDTALSRPFVAWHMSMSCIVV
jgi:hypothetical protein